MMTIFAPKIEPPIGSRLLIYTTIVFVVLIFLFPLWFVNDVQAGNWGVLFLRLIIASCLYLAIMGIVIGIVGPIVGFPIYFLHELLRRSRLPHFRRNRIRRCTGILLTAIISLFLVSSRYIVLTEYVNSILFSMLLVTGGVYTRLRYPRSPWPRIFYIYGPCWLKQALVGIISIFFVGEMIDLPNTAVKLVSLSIPLLIIGGQLHKMTRVHRGGHLRIPNKCVLLLRPFGFDDDNFADLNRGLFSILDPNRGTPFDAFVCTSVEKQLGAFVSFGDPGDITLRRGARRHYVADTHWRAIFEGIISKPVAFLAVIPTTSEGFLWELTRLRQLDLHTRLFLFTPPICKLRCKPLLLKVYDFTSNTLLPHWQVPSMQDSWRHMTLNLAPIGYQLTEYPGPGAVIGFSADGMNMVLARNCEEPSEFIAPVRVQLHSNNIILC